MLKEMYYVKRNKFHMVIYGIWLLSNFLSCGQKKEISLTGKEPLIITEENFISTLQNEITSYPEEPLYFLTIHQTNCNYEILINDFPIYRNFKNPVTTNLIYINRAILRSGLQQICYRLYPENGKETLEDSSEIQISICRKYNKKGGKNHEEFISYLNPKIDKISGEGTVMKISEASGKKFYENHLSFHAEVPYKNKGWSNGQDLQKLDSSELKKEVLAFYKNQWNLLENKKTNEILSSIYERAKENAISEYNNKNDLKANLKYYLTPLKSSYYELQPLENYKIVFYGNGKLVCLENACSDSLLKGEQVLWAKYKDENGKIASNFRNFYLYLPKNKNLRSGLEIIR